MFLGFDPGGINRFGVATISGSLVSFRTVSNIKEAMEWSIESSKGQKPVAAGIDTILHWSTGQSSFRNADIWLRKNYPQMSRSVMAPNSLYGAMTIGGVGLAIKLREVWPNLLLNETHPKVLYHALTKKSYPRLDLSDAYSWMKSEAKLSFTGLQPSEDEFDAIISAWATREAIRLKWKDSTVIDDDHIYPVSDVHYLWPSLK